MGGSMIRIMLVLLALTPLRPAFAHEAILAAERQELSSYCTEIGFGDGFLSEADINGDNLPDAVVDYGSLQCDGSQSAFCGSGGCTIRLYMQHADGTHALVGDLLAHAVVFDRPAEASFLVASHGSACGRVGAEACDLRFKLEGGRMILLGEAGENGDVVPPTDRWTYLEDSRTALIGPDDAQLSLTCEDGAIRIRYSADWMMYDREDMTDHILSWTKEQSETAYFDAGGAKAETPVHFVKELKRLTPLNAIALDAPLIDGLARAKWVSIEHGGSLEHTLEYSLKGSSAAIKALRASCGN